VATCLVRLRAEAGAPRRRAAVPQGARHLAENPRDPRSMCSRPGLDAGRAGFVRPKITGMVMFIRSSVADWLRLCFWLPRPYWRLKARPRPMSTALMPLLKSTADCHGRWPAPQPMPAPRMATPARWNSHGQRAGRVAENVQRYAIPIAVVSGRLPGESGSSAWKSSINVLPQHQCAVSAQSSPNQHRCRSGSTIRPTDAPQSPASAYFSTTCYLGARAWPNIDLIESEARSRC